MFNSVRSTRPSCLVTCVAGKAGPLQPFYLGTTCWWSQKLYKSPHRWGSAPYPSKVRMKPSLSTVLYDLLRSSNNSKRGLWYIMVSYCASFNSIVAILVPLSVRNLCRTSWNWRLARRRVSMIASTNLQRVSCRTMPLVPLVPLCTRTKIFHTNYCGISPTHHMC